MQKQLDQLTDWLRDIEGIGQSSEDEDVLNTRQEVKEVRQNIICKNQLFEVLRGYNHYKIFS